MHPQFHDPMLSMSLGPVIRPEPPKPEPHLVHDWRPIEGQPDHVKCIGCGAVALREYVMPPEAPVPVVEAPPELGLQGGFLSLPALNYSPQIDIEFEALLREACLRKPPPSVFTDSALEQIRREDAFAREHRTWLYVCKPVEDDDL